VLTTSETSDHSSSLLWTPAQPPIKQAKEKVRRKQDALTLKKQTREDALTLKNKQEKIMTISFKSVKTDPQSLSFLFQQPTLHRVHRKSHKSKRRLYKDEKTTESGETSAFLSKQEQENNRIQSEKLCSFEQAYQQHRRSRSNSGRHSSKRSSKKHQELYNDYTRYQYHRRSHRVCCLYD
jgi:hypothetical protein